MKKFTGGEKVVSQPYHILWTYMHKQKGGGERKIWSGQTCQVFVAQDRILS